MASGTGRGGGGGGGRRVAEIEEKRAIFPS